MIQSKSMVEQASPLESFSLGQFIETIEKRQGLKVGCLEEIAYEKGFISLEQLRAQARRLQNTTYGNYLMERYGK